MCGCPLSRKCFGRTKQKLYADNKVRLPRIDDTQGCERCKGSVKAQYRLLIQEFYLHQKQVQTASTISRMLDPHNQQNRVSMRMAKDLSCNCTIVSAAGKTSVGVCV